MTVSKRTPESERTLLQMLEIGLGYESAAGIVGVTTQTLRNWRRDDPELEMACVQAKNRGKARVVGKLLELVNKGNLGAICFWLKTRTEEFRENRKDEDQEATESEAVTLLADLEALRRNNKGEGWVDAD